MKHNQTAITALLLASALCLTACGKEASSTWQNSTPQNTTNADVSVDITTTTKETSAEESTEATLPHLQSEEYTKIDWGSLSIQIPKDFYYVDIGCYYGTTEHNQKAYFVYTQDSYYKEEHPDEEYTAADVQKIIDNRINFGNFYSYVLVNGDAHEANSTEEIDVLGTPFILQKGTVHSATQEENLQYVGCYGVIDAKQEEGPNDDIPLAWIAYTKETSEEALADLEEVVRNAAKSAQFTT